MCSIVVNFMRVHIIMCVQVPESKDSHCEITSSGEGRGCKEVCLLSGYVIVM